MGLEQLTFEGLNKVEVAIGLLQAFEPPEGYYLAFSGGKDSVAIYDMSSGIITLGVFGRWLLGKGCRFVNVDGVAK